MRHCARDAVLAAAKDTFSSTYISTIGVDFKITKLKLGDDCVLKLLIWDSSGQGRFNGVTDNYVRSVQAVLVVFDVRDAHSFEVAEQWMTTVAGLNRKVIGWGTMALVGNKADVDSVALAPRVVTQERAQELAAAHGLPYFETSAKEGAGVEAPFHYLAMKLKDALPPSANLRQATDRITTNTGRPCTIL